MQMHLEPHKRVYSGLEITEKNYLSVGNITKNFTSPSQFQPFWPANFGFLALIEVKKGTFPSENLRQLLPFRHNFYLFRKGGKAVNSSPGLYIPSQVFRVRVHQNPLSTVEYLRVP